MLDTHPITSQTSFAIRQCRFMINSGMLHFRKTLRWVLISVAATVLPLSIMSQFPDLEIPAPYWFVAVLLPALISYFVSRKLIQQTEDLADLNRALTEANATLTVKLRAESLLNVAFATISQGCSIYDENDCLVFAMMPIARSTPCRPLRSCPDDPSSPCCAMVLLSGNFPKPETLQEEQEAWLRKCLENHRNPTGPVLQKVGPDRWIQVEEYVTKDNFRVGLRTDVSALLRIKSEAEQLGRIIEGVAQEVYLISLTDGRIVNANKAARDNLQYSLEELRGLTARDLKLDTALSTLRRPLRRSSRAGARW
jgi:PAS domain-containing protein